MHPSMPTFGMSDFGLRFDHERLLWLGLAVNRATSRQVEYSIADDELVHLALRPERRPGLFARRLASMVRWRREQAEIEASKLRPRVRIHFRRRRALAPR